jgi:hypothetical protein
MVKQQVLCKVKPAAKHPRPRKDRARVALAPRLPLNQTAYATTFHRALDLFNIRHGTARQWDDLTEHEQIIVRELTKTLDREAHPCRQDL